MIVSDDSIKSSGCMYELLEMLKDEDYKKRFLPVVIKNTKIYNCHEISSYVRYWDNKYNELEQKVADLPKEAITYACEELKLISNFRNDIGDFLHELSQTYHIKAESDSIADTDVNKIINAIIGADKKGKIDDVVIPLPEPTKKIYQEISPSQLARLEKNYLHQINQMFLDMQKHPMPHDEKEIIDLQAELIEPKFRIFEFTEEPKSASSQGKLTSNLVRTLLDSKTPVVVLGDPGAGKSVSLRKVGMAFVTKGLKEKAPLLPIYLRLGTYTGRSENGPISAVDFAKQSLQNLGGHAIPIARRFDEYLYQGRLVFLLDAMDEMPRRDYPERFESLSELRHFTANKFLFACRKIDFRESFPFKRAIIQPFTRKQVKKFLHKTLDSLGESAAKQAAKQILSRDNPLRQMAYNPFFLKLLSLYYLHFKKLPESRAELMHEYEAQVLKRARCRGSFPKYLSDITIRIVLARLGYLITTSERGVTLPIDDFKKKFVENDLSESARLRVVEPLIDSVLEIARTEELLIFDEEICQGVSNTIISFYHHRLQEYYTAVYLEEFHPAINWPEYYDDIWWQEILVMFFGVCQKPDLHMQALLETMPHKPIVCCELGTRLYELIETQVVYGEEVDTPQVIKEFLTLDACGFYDLAINLKDKNEIPQILETLISIGILPPSINPTGKVYMSFKELSPEPDENEEADCIRRWLEHRNAILLDRLNLAIECFRNASGKISTRPISRFVQLIQELVKDGNTWESVRGIHLAACLPAVDLYSILEPALLHRNAWCRRQAMEAITKYPLQTSTYLGHTGFIIFLQFTKGELLAALPNFFHCLSERPKLRRFIPGISILSIITLLGIIFPFSIYAILLWQHPNGIFGLNHLLGMDWNILAKFLSGIVILWIYISKYKFDTSIIRTTLFVVGLIIGIPIIIYLFSMLPSSTTNQELIKAMAFHDRMINEFKNSIKILSFGLVIIPLMYFPQLMEFVVANIMSLVSMILFGSKKIGKIPYLLLKEVFSKYDKKQDNYFDKAQVVIFTIAFVGIFMGIIGGVIFLVIWIFSIYKLFFLSVLVTLLIVAFAIGLIRTHNRKKMLKKVILGVIISCIIISLAYLIYKFLLIPFYFYVLVPVGHFLLNFLLIPIYDYVLVPIGHSLKALWNFLGIYLATFFVSVILQVVIILIAKFLIHQIKEIKAYCTLILRRFFKLYMPSIDTRSDLNHVLKHGTPGEILEKVDKFVKTQNTYPKERYDFYRHALRFVNKGWLRSYFYREMAKDYKEMRQERINKNDQR